VTVRIEADESDLVTGLDEGKRALGEFGNEVERTAGRTINLTSKGRDLVFAMLAVRGAFSLSRQIMKEFGIESEAAGRALHFVELATYAAIVASKLYRVAKGLEALASRSAAVAHFFEATGKVASSTLFIGLAAAVAASIAAIGIFEALTPRAQFGGVFQPRPGGTMVRVAEAGVPEAVIPLDRRFPDTARSGRPISVTFNVQTNDPDALARTLGRKIQEMESAGAL